MSLLLLLKNPADVTPPVTPPGVAPSIIPTAVVEIDFQGNPTATYSDIQSNQDNTLAFWRMNSATTFLDERLAHNGTIIGTPSTTTSPYSYDSDLALAFDGSADGAYVASATDLINKGDMTIAGWLKLPSYPAATRDIVAKRGAWLLQVTSAGKLVWTLKDDNSGATVTSNTTLAVGTWYHVAAVYDSVNISLYINGVLDNSTAYSSGWEASNTPIRFAATPSTGVPAWQSSTTATASSAIPTGTLPGSTAAGDLLLAHIHAGRTGSISVTSAPVGWTLLGSATGTSGSTIIAQVYSKVATASEPASYSWGLSTGTRWQVAISRITGVNTLTPLANPAYAVFGTGPYVTGSHIPNTDNNMVLAFFSSESLFSYTESSGTERYDTHTGQNGIAMSSQTQATAAAISVTGTGTTAAGSAIMVVVAGSGESYAAVSMKDWAFSNVARTTSEIARDYASRTSGTGTWTDVSTEVRSWDVAGAARQYELDQMEAGTTSVLLRDMNRDFDPANGSSAYSPNVIPLRKIRGRTTYQGTEYYLWQTYIERWPPQNAIPGYQEIGITSVDGFDGLALADVRGTLNAGYSGTQIQTLLDKALWPKDKRSVEQGQYVMAAQTLSGKALGTIQEIADSERGIFFIDRAGNATFHDSAHRGSYPRSTASQVTFVDNEAGNGIPYQDLTPSFDKDKIINEWTVTPDSSTFGAAAQTLVDARSQAQYFKRANSRSTRLISNADAAAQAGNLLNETAQPAERFDTLTVLPTTTAAYETCLGLRISDRVTVRRGDGPVWDGDILSKECFIEAKRISARPAAPWVFTFSLSPVSSGNYYSTIVRDGPVSYWRMDTQT